MSIAKSAWMAAIVLLSLASFGAIAHTQLSSSAPVDGAVLAAPPAELVLEFSATVTLTAVTVHSADESQRLALPDERSARRFALAAPDLGAGEHRLEWRVLSEDTHVMTGRIVFTIKPD